MVALSLIQQSNAKLDKSCTPRVAVFVGGTAGIGKITLAEIAEVGTPFKAYVVGRPESEESFKTFAAELQQANPATEIVWVEGQVSLLREVKRVCDYIKTLETSIDLLFMTTGYAPFNGRHDTEDGLDVVHAITYYIRMCFVQNLLPELRTSGSARVISVHSGHMLLSAWQFNEADLNLEKPGAYSGMHTQIQMGILNTLELERLAELEENRGIVFIHSHPGIVRTGNLYRGFQEGSWGMWFGTWVMDPILMLVQFSMKESAERHLYQVTSGTFGGRGPLLEGVRGQTTRGKEHGGLFLVTKKCDTTMAEKELAKLRKAQGVVSDKTREILRQYV